MVSASSYPWQRDWRCFCSCMQGIWEWQNVEARPTHVCGGQVCWHKLKKMVSNYVANTAPSLRSHLCHKSCLPGHGKGLAVICFIERGNVLWVCGMSETRGPVGYLSVSALKDIFTRYELPVMPISDNRQQYVGYHFKNFCKTYGCEHVTSSPKYSQLNGAVDRAV